MKNPESEYEEENNFAFSYFSIYITVHTLTAIATISIPEDLNQYLCKF
jgi:hypothetical protein